MIFHNIKIYYSLLFLKQKQKMTKKKEPVDVGMALASPTEQLAIRETLAGYDKVDLQTPMTIPKASWADYYAIGMCVVLGPFAILVWVFFTLFSFPLLAIWTGYMNCCVKSPSDRDNSLAFKVVGILTYPYAALLYAFSAFWWWFAFAAIMFMSLPACFIRTVFLCQGSKIRNNFKLLRPWMTFNHFSYFMLTRAVVGEIHRQGLCEFVFGKGIMGGWAANVAYIPLIKYTWSANPLLYVLEEVFINQWTPPIKNFAKDDLIEKTRVFVSRFKHEADERLAIDHVKFAAHYPFGKSRCKQPDSVIGIQFPNKSKMINMTNTIHVTPEYKNEYSMPGKNCRSETGQEGVYVVKLNWFSHHFLTGYVEVNFRKDKGLEHPMWCVVPRDNYWGMQSYSWVNDLFASFVPDVVEFVNIVDADNGSMA